MENPFVFSREPRTRPSREIFAQVRSPGAVKDYVLSVRDVSPSGALFELDDLQPPWLRPGRVVELTLVGEGEDGGAEFRGPIARVVNEGPRRVFAVRLDRPCRRSRKYLERAIDDGQTVRPKSAPLP